VSLDPLPLRLAHAGAASVGDALSGNAPHLPPAPLPPHAAPPPPPPPPPRAGGGAAAAMGAGLLRELGHHRSSGQDLLLPQGPAASSASVIWREAFQISAAAESVHDADEEVGGGGGAMPGLWRGAGCAASPRRRELVCVTTSGRDLPCSGPPPPPSL
jgi:hypothetical protein